MFPQALSNAVREEKDPNKIKAIIAEYKNDIYEDDGHQGDTLLHLAALYDNAEFFKQLLEQGVRLDTANKNGKNPLQLALQHNAKGIIHFLAQHQEYLKPELNFKTNEGESLLSLALRRGSAEIFYALHKTCCTDLSDANNTNDSGQNLAHLLALSTQLASDDVEKIATILAKAGVDFKAKDRHGKDPLQLATLHRKPGIVLAYSSSRDEKAVQTSIRHLFFGTKSPADHMVDALSTSWTRYQGHRDNVDSKGDPLEKTQQQKDLEDDVWAAYRACERGETVPAVSRTRTNAEPKEPELAAVEFGSPNPVAA